MKRPLFGVVLAATLAFFSCQSDDSVEDICASMDDEVFKNYCYEHFDTNADGKLSQAEANAVYTIYIYGLDVRSLNGIEHFTKLEELAVEECENLREVVIPNTVPLLIFKDCNNLESFYGKYASLDNRCVIVDGKLCAFAPSGLTEYTIPDGVTSIGNGAFNFCKNLTSITIPDSVTWIGGSAFEGCENLTSITIPDGVTSIEASAFSGCSSLTSITIPDGVTSIEASAFNGCSSLTSITIPDGVTSIGGVAFSGCSSLTSITIPDGVTLIEASAFNGCSSLKSITIPDSVTSIGASAFSGCSSLKSFYGKFVSADNRCVIVDGELCAFVPSGLTEYTIPDSVTSIGGFAFEDCKNLTSITIPDSVTSIGDYAFNGCENLKSITIPDSVTSIEFSAFNGCSSLTSITIPDSVTSIGDGAFSFCENLTSVYCKATIPPTGDSDMFDDNASGRKIYVPMNSVEAYKVANMWKEYADDIVGYDF